MTGSSSGVYMESSIHGSQAGIIKVAVMVWKLSSNVIT